MSVIHVHQSHYCLLLCQLYPIQFNLNGENWKRHRTGNGNVLWIRIRLGYTSRLSDQNEFVDKHKLIDWNVLSGLLLIVFSNTTGLHTYKFMLTWMNEWILWFYTPKLALMQENNTIFIAFNYSAIQQSNPVKCVAIKVYSEDE